MISIRNIAAVSNFHSSKYNLFTDRFMQIISFFVNMPKESVLLIDKTCVLFLPSCWNCSYDPFVFTLKLTQNYIIVLNNRFKGFGGSICVVLCMQGLEQQSVRS